MNRLLIVLLLIIMCKLAVSQQKQEICSIAKLHYSQEEVKSMSSKYIERVNFYFSSSYILVDNSNGKLDLFIQKYCNGNMFDITNFENGRKKSYRNELNFEDFPEISISLLSWDEINAKYSEIENNYKN